MNDRTIRVLLVENNEQECDSLRERFASLGGDFALTCVAGDDAGLEAMRGRGYDVCLLADRLGSHTGLELLRAARQEEGGKPVIVLAQRGEEASNQAVRAAIEAGADDYLEKSTLDAARLERAIRFAHQRGTRQRAWNQRVEELTAELDRSREALREAERRRDDFLSVLAHELRNPLAPIRTGLDVMKLAAGNPAVFKEVRDAMDRQVSELVRMVDELLEASRIARGKIELQRSRVNLGEVIQTAVNATRPAIEEARHQLTVSVPPEPIMLHADPRRIAQVLSQLLNNAARYTPEGGQIWLTAGRQDDFATVSVRDTGLGVSAGEQERIFEMFAQAEHTRTQARRGLGIGLTLVKSLVELHGGTVKVRSEGENRGSEFLVRLPVLEEASDRSSQDAGSGQKRRVIVVDDNPAAADLLSRVVEILGHDVRTAYEGLQSLETAAEFQPDVMIVDLRMPVLDGYEVARRIRAQPWGQRTLLIALTGWSQGEDRHRTREAGFDHHLLKPAEPAVLQKLFAESR